MMDEAHHRLIYESFRVTGVHDTVLDYADLFTLSLQNDDVQEFDTKWDEILCSELEKLRIRDSNSKTIFGTLRDGASSKDVEAWGWRLWWRGPWSKISRHETSRPETRGTECEQCQRIEGRKKRWRKRSRRMLSMESIRTSSKRKQQKFPPRWKSKLKINTKVGYFLLNRKKTVNNCRERRIPEAEVLLGNCIESRAETTVEGPF